MIPGFDPLTIGSLLVLASSSLQCEIPKPTVINVNPTTLETKYDYTQSLAELQGYALDTIDPHGFGGVSYTQGFMKGGIRMEPRVTLGYAEYPHYGAVCVWYDAIDIDIEIDPTIVIAREVHADPCMGKVVRQHELKHVKADRQIVNKYAKIMGQKVYKALQERGFKSGVMQAAHLEAIQQRMHQTVLQVVEHEYKKMELERAEIQSAIDSLGEYQRVQGACPKFQSPTDFNP